MRVDVVVCLIPRPDVAQVVFDVLPCVETWSIGGIDYDTTYGCFTSGSVHITTYAANMRTHMVRIRILAVRIVYVVLASILRTQNVAHMVAPLIPPA